MVAVAARTGISRSEQTLRNEACSLSRGSVPLLQLLLLAFPSSVRPLRGLLTEIVPPTRGDKRNKRAKKSDVEDEK